MAKQIDRLHSYKKEKEELFKDFGIKLKPKEKEHLYSLTSEVAIDNYARKILGIQSSIKYTSNNSKYKFDN